MEPTITHGGKRSGAGRKPTGKGRSIPRSIRVSPPVDRYLAEFGTGKAEDAIRKSKHFRDWQMTGQSENP